MSQHPHPTETRRTARTGVPAFPRYTSGSIQRKRTVQPKMPCLKLKETRMEPLVLSVRQNDEAILKGTSRQRGAHILEVPKLNGVCRVLCLPAGSQAAGVLL